LIGVAATHPTAREFPRLPTTARIQVNKSRLGSLCLAVLVGPLLLVFDGKDVVIVAVASALSFLLVMARMTGLNWSLAALGVELEEQATTDALTGLLNRSAFNHAIAAALKESHEQVGMLMIDLDDFKRVNDLAGHSSGDALLVEVAQRMRSIGRSTDIMGSFGGRTNSPCWSRGRPIPRSSASALSKALGVRFLVGGTHLLHRCQCRICHGQSGHGTRTPHPGGRHRHVRRQGSGKEPPCCLHAIDVHGNRR